MNMTRFVGKKVHPKDTCFDEIGLCAQNINILSGSTMEDGVIGEIEKRSLQFELDL